MPVTIKNVYAVRKTPKALICVIDDDEYIVPDSQITDDSEVYREGDDGDLVITDWIADKLGIM